LDRQQAKRIHFFSAAGDSEEGARSGPGPESLCLISEAAGFGSDLTGFELLGGGAGGAEGGLVTISGLRGGSPRLPQKFRDQIFDWPQFRHMGKLNQSHFRAETHLGRISHAGFDLLECIEKPKEVFPGKKIGLLPQVGQNAFRNAQSAGSAMPPSKP